MSSKSLYSPTHSWAFKNNTNVPDTKRAWVVNGQGGAYPGMFLFYLKENRIFQEVFSSLDQAASMHDFFPFSLYLTDPARIPIEKMHIYKNCSLYACQVALGKNLIELGLPPDYITAHSYGECAALVLAGIIDHQEMLEVVIQRNLVCPPAQSIGKMITLNTTKEKLEELLQIEGVYLANINSRKQTVISVKNTQEKEVLSWLRGNRVPHLVLTELPQPYHSPLMQPYSDAFRKKFLKKKLTISPPQYDFFSGIKHRWITKDNYNQINFESLLADQFTEPVNFIEQIEAIEEKSVTHFYEIGPGKILEHSIRNNLSGKFNYRNSEEHIPLLFEQQKNRQKSKEIESTNPIFLTLKKIIGKVTGYKDHDIDVYDNFQDDLGIDSLRKADILVQLIDKQGISTNSDFSITRFNYINEVIEYLENYSENNDPFVITHDPEIKLYEPYLAKTNLIKYPPFKIPVSKTLEVLIKNGWQWSKLEELIILNEQRVIYILRLQDSSYLNESTPKELHAPFLNFLNAHNGRDLQLIICDEGKSESALPLISLMRSIAKEYTNFNVRYLHTPSMSLSIDQCLEEANSNNLRDTYYLEGERYIKLWREFLPQMVQERQVNLIATGGAKGIGYEIVSRIPPKCRGKLLIIGRSQLKDVESNVEGLTPGWREVKYLSLDVKNITSHIDEIKTFFDNENIDLLLNTTGTEVSKNFEDRKVEDIEEELNSKIAPFTAIEQLKKLISINRTLHSTSIVSQFGNKGQSIYSWSNTWIENHLSENSHSLAWAPWQEVGMTTSLGILQKIKEWGISLITPTQGAELCIQLMFHQADLPKVIIPMDKKDILLLSIEGLKESTLGTLDHNFEAVFYKEIDLDKNNYLNGHLVWGKKLIPAAYFISQIFALSRSLYGKIYALENFNIENALIFQDNHLSYKIQAFWRNDYKFSIFSTIPHIKGSLNPKLILPKESYHPQKEEKEIEIKSFYNKHGVRESFQFIKRAFLDKNKNIRTEFDSKDLPKFTDHFLFDFWMVLLDIGFQTLNMQTRVDGAENIPTNIQKIVFSEDLNFNTIVSIYPQIKEINKKHGLADIIYTDSSGTVLLKIIDIKFRIGYFKDFIPLSLKGE